jgi:hypothetical protein
MGLGRSLKKMWKKHKVTIMSGGISPLGWALDAQRRDRQRANELADAQRKGVHGEIARRKRNVTDVRETFGVGKTLEARNNAARIGSRLQTQEGLAREAGEAQDLAEGSADLRRSNAAQVASGVGNSSVAQSRKAAFVGNVQARRARLGGSLAGMKQGALDALAQQRSSLEQRVSGGASIEPQQAQMAQAAALRSYASGVPGQTLGNMLSTGVGFGVQSALARERGFDTPDFLGLGRLTSRVSNSPGRTERG